MCIFEQTKDRYSECVCVCGGGGGVFMMPIRMKFGVYHVFWKRLGA